MVTEIPFLGSDTGLSRRRLLRDAGALAALTAVGVSGVLDTAQALAEPDPAAPPPPVAADLVETAANQNRWLSLPFSRLVVNPYNGTSSLSPLQFSSGPDVPLNLGYYVADTAANLASAVGIYQRRTDRPGSIDVTWTDDFDAIDPEWTIGTFVDAEVADSQLRLNLRTESKDWWGTITRWVDVDLDASPYIQLSVTELADAWGLRVSEDGTAQRVLQPDSNDTGVFTYNIAELTGWTGQKRIQLIVRVAIWNKPARFDFIRLLGVTPILSGASGTDARWLPHALPWIAHYPDSTTISGADVFTDLDSVLRSCVIAAPADTTGAWTLAGKYVGTPSWDAATRTLTVETDQYAYAVAIDARTDGDTGFFGTLLELLAGTNATTPPPARGFWSIPIRLGRSARVGTAVGFATVAEGGAATARQRARDALPIRVEQAMRIQERFWNRLLQRVPRPTNFNLLGGIDPVKITADNVRAMYYKAWIFLAAGVLPPMPEVDFPFPQLATGKPSLYVFGPRGAASSAPWESILAIQFYAYIDPAGAWAAFRGLMSLVRPDGTQDGEQLPARHAQTAAVLYGVTGDIEQLRAVYPALRAHLLWKESDPRWIFRTNTPPDQKDAQFLVSVLLDMRYARDLAKVLGLNDDVRMWDQHRATSFANYLTWFWTSPTADPIEFFVPSTGNRNGGNIMWIAGGMHLDLWPAGSPQLAGLVRRFFRTFRLANFAGFEQPKYPDFSLASYGLLDLGRRAEAVILVNSAMRDVIRSNQFAESYIPFIPAGTGVRPSFFGAGFVLETVWINNGYRMDGGVPQFVHFTDDAVGLSGLRIRGKTLDLVKAAGSNTVQLSGSLVGERPGCTALEIPLGGTASLAANCGAGTLSTPRTTSDPKAL